MKHHPPAGISPPKAALRVLVIDDEPGIRELLSYEFTRKGFEVRTAPDGPSAMALASKEKFQLAVCDLLMPGMDGIAVLKALKQIDSSLEVIMATGYGTVENALTAIKEGAFDFVLKPFNIDEMMLLADRALEKSELKALVALYETSQVLFTRRNLNELLDVVLKHVQKVIHADRSSIMLKTPAGNLKVAASQGHGENPAEISEQRIGSGIAGRAAELKREFLLINGLHNYPEFAGELSSQSIHSAVVCPMMAQDEVVGVLNLSRTEDSQNFTPADLRNASIFAAQAALAVQNAQLHDELQGRCIELRSAYESLAAAQNLLLQSEKLASIGRLVSGVAHEINNPLTAVLGYSQLILSGNVQGELHSQVSIIYKEAERCRRIVQDLLIFAGRRKPQVEPVNPWQLLDECVRAMALVFEQRQIAVSLEFPKQPPMVLGDAVQLKQVFNNILNNACKALDEIPDTRQIHVRAEVSADGHLEIRIIDNGPGIPPEARSRIFDPFYTTREVGQGTGLGLSITYGIVRDHGGVISVEDHAGPGACFLIRLPVAQEDVSTRDSTGPTPGPNAVPAADNEVKAARILLVDDEAMIRGFIKSILESKGHTIETAADGEAALEMILRNSYDLIICDYRLPKLNGKEIFMRACREKSEIAKRFLFITGSITIGSNAGDDFFRSGEVPAIAKPFTGHDLLAVVQQKLVKMAA